MMQLPKMLLVRQKFPDRRIPIDDITGIIQQQMNAHAFADRFEPGASISIGVGSRGISNLPLIVHEVVSYWKGKGMKPFIVPAMGSHGGATDEGQKAELAKRGITEESAGCPIESSMNVVSMGKTPEGIETFMSEKAFGSKGVFLINRVNRHTDFSGPIESGLCKMATIGLGNQIGAASYHRIAFTGKMGLDRVIPAAARHLFASGKIIGGLAILEDANNNTAQLAAIPAGEIEQKEKELLDLVKGWKGSIPIREWRGLDVLIVNEIGKNISGPGMDPKVVNRSSTTGIPNPLKDGSAPWIGRIYVRSLHPDSNGNAIGIGMADIVHEQVTKAMNEQTTRINADTAQIPKVADIPAHYSTDRECLEKIVPLTSDPANPRIGWIINSKELGFLALSENLRPEIEANPQLEIIGDPQPFRFDAKGQLVSPFSALQL